MDGTVDGGARMVEFRTLDEEVLDLMFQVLGLLKQHFHTAIVEMGLTPQQAHALRALDPTRPVPMRELAAGIMCDASTVTGIVDRLESRGLVERRPDPDDRRVKGLVVTPAGIEVRDRIWRQVLGHAPHLAVLSPEERTQLRDQLRRVIDANGPGATPARGTPISTAAGG
jgi:DNA-binding MarR family transcriptional regulator